MSSTEEPNDQTTVLVEEPNPEDFLPTKKLPPRFFEKYPASGSTWLANFLCSAILMSSLLRWWMLDRFNASRENMTPYSHDLFSVSKAQLVDQHEWWRLVSALGGHGDWMHFLHNVPILWFFTWILNAYFGWKVTLAAVFVTGILSNFLTVMNYENNVRLLGASGMIYGLVAFWLVLYVYFDRTGHWTKRTMRSFGFAMLVFFPQTYETNVSYLAHFSGFLSGIALAAIMIPVVRRVAPVFHDPYYASHDVGEEHSGVLH